MTTWTKEALNPAIFTKEIKNIIRDGFLLLEDGNFILLENSSKVVLNYGWTKEEK